MHSTRHNADSCDYTIESKIGVEQSVGYIKREDSGQCCSAWSDQSRQVTMSQPGRSICGTRSKKKCTSGQRLLQRPVKTPSVALLDADPSLLGSFLELLHVTLGKHLRQQRRGDGSAVKPVRLRAADLTTGCHTLPQRSKCCFEWRPA